MVSDIQRIIQKLVKFRVKRDWKQFHNPKDLALAISIESAELLEVFLWKNSEDADKEKIKEELADVLAFSFLLADLCNLNVGQIVSEKLRSNAKKYPVSKAKGVAKKYDQL